ncbi:MAG: pyridoxine 5'-phosphate synthase [Gammaproteobacteria bacterium]
MTTHLSVNLNKVALLRNQRDIGIPSVLKAARTCIAAGSRGITVHPRPDERHIRYADVYELAELLGLEFPHVEFNIEGNPFEGRFLEVVHDVRPTQCTLVPDATGAVTSDHGWDLQANLQRLRAVVQELRELGCRVSLFVDHDSPDLGLARESGAHRIELYTEPYAAAFAAGDADSIWQGFADATRQAQDIGLGVNAGHDLNLDNLGRFCAIPGILEVSIGHALTADALDLGLFNAVREYLKVTALADGA